MLGVLRHNGIEFVPWLIEENQLQNNDEVVERYTGTKEQCESSFLQTFYKPAPKDIAKLDRFSGFISTDGKFYYAHFADHTRTARAIMKTLGVSPFEEWITVKQGNGIVYMWLLQSELTPKQKNTVIAIEGITGKLVEIFENSLPF